MRAGPLTIPLVSVALLAAAASPATATTIKYADNSGTVPTGAPISGALKPSTVWHFEGGSGGDIDCSASDLAGSLETNPFIPSVPGKLTRLTLGSCSDTTPFVTVSGITSNAGTGTNAKPLSFMHGLLGTRSTFAMSGIELTIMFASGSTCIYQPTGGTATATHNSTTTPWNNEYAFTNVPLTKTGGTYAFCPSSNLTFTATYVLTSSGKGITIQP
jgi:hypothetical protein